MSPLIECSNLQTFLHSMTPVVPSKPLPQSCLNDLINLWHPAGKDSIEYFTLGALWRCFDEWSAYGLGTPVVINNHRTVVQYYTPYLSAVQIYTTKPYATLRNLREHTNALEFDMESWSDGSESDKLSRSLSNNSRKTCDATSPDSSFDHEGSLQMRDRLGYLYFQYHDVSSPYWRIPLSEKIIDFTQSYPGLVTLKSVDLSPASWMSIAWYPIYHIPTKWYVKDLAACFLTYHTLSSSFQDSAWENDYGDSGNEISSAGVMGESKEKCGSGVSLTPFGLATYRMQGDIWINPEQYDRDRLIDLHSAADSWLKQLNFHHHDFNFFNMHSNSILKRDRCCSYA